MTIKERGWNDLFNASSHMGHEEFCLRLFSLLGFGRYLERSGADAPEKEKGDRAKTENIMSKIEYSFFGACRREEHPDKCEHSERVE